MAAGPSGATMNDLKSVLKGVEKLPGSSMFGAKEVDEIMQSTAKIVGDEKEDWMIRWEALRRFRSLCADRDHHNKIVEFLELLVPPLQIALVDSRPYILREACLTLAYIAYRLEIKSVCFLEPFMPALFSLLVANPKVVTITALDTIRLVYEYVPSCRLIPAVLVQMNQSRTKEVHQAVCSVVQFILAKWPKTTIHLEAIPLQQIIKEGLTDWDAEARKSTRDEAFPIFQQMFPGLAQSILDALEPLRQSQHVQKLVQELEDAKTASLDYQEKLQEADKMISQMSMNYKKLQKKRQDLLEIVRLNLDDTREEELEKWNQIADWKEDSPCGKSTRRNSIA